MKVSHLPGIVAMSTVVALTLGACAGSTGGAQSDRSASGAAQSGTATLSVVASTNVWGDVVSQVGGHTVAVTSIISDPDKDPHEYEADARQQLALSKAHIVIENGGGYDDFVDTMLSSAKSKATVINAVDVSGFKATQGNNLNEHVWYDYPTVTKVATSIEEALASADPGNAATYAQNLRAFTSKVETLQKAVADVKAKDAGKGVAITEPVPLYLLEAMGLENRTPEAFSEAIEEETDVSASVLQQTLAIFSQHQVSALVYNEQTTGSQTEAVLGAAKSAGIAVVAVQETLPSGLDYIAWQTKIIDEVSQALSK